MTNYTQKIIAVIGLSLGLPATIPSQLAAGTQENIELVTALLRGPAASWEFELRNDTSCSAYAKRAAIDLIRIINNLFSTQDTFLAQSLNVSHFVYSMSNALPLRTGKEAQKPGEEKKEVLEKTPDTHAYKIMGRFVLPALEMFCALARAQKLSAPSRGKILGANIGLDFARIAQFYLINMPQDPKAQRLLAATLVLVGIIVLCAEASAYDSRCTTDKQRKIFFDGVALGRKISELVSQNPQLAQDTEKLCELAGASKYYRWLS
jgi:hypothetical protein